MQFYCEYGVRQGRIGIAALYADDVDIAEVLVRPPPPPARCLVRSYEVYGLFVDDMVVYQGLKIEI